MTVPAIPDAATSIVNPQGGGLRAWRDHRVGQAVVWPDESALHAAERNLGSRRPLVSPNDCRRLTEGLAAAGSGRALVLQGGPCAESFRDEPADVDALVALLRELAGALRSGTGKGVVTVARLAGQYAKPRSAITENVAGYELPVFRGHAVHDDAPTPAARRPDPARLVETYRRSRQTMLRLGPARMVFSSHEALLLEYEEALIRRMVPDGEWYAGSGHLLWIGERTRDPDGAHVALLAEIANPVAVKLGPFATPDQVAELCRRLNPHRRPGRLTLVTRLGVGRVEAVLPSLVAAVSEEQQPVTWLCDPMHGNTRFDSAGAKFRRVPDLMGELRTTVVAHREAGSSFGGIHIEVTADDVQECVDVDEIGERRYTSLCDPRLNADQARSLVDALVRDSAR